MSRDSSTRRIEVGTKFASGGETWRVIQLTGRTLTVASVASPSRRASMSVADVISDPSFRVISQPDGTTYAEDGLDRALQTQMTGGELTAPTLRKLTVVNLLTTGYPMGAPRTADEEPDPELGPTSPLSLDDQYVIAAKRHGASRTSIRRWVDKYRTHGVSGLVDQRELHVRDPRGKCPRLVWLAFGEILAEHVGKSKVSDVELIRQVKTRAVRLGFTGAMPCDKSLSNYLKVHKQGRAFHQETKHRRSEANKGKNAKDSAYRPMVATHPGERVELDSTPLDLMLIDDSGKERTFVKGNVLAAVDAYSRAVLACRVIAGAPRKEDVTLLLFDMLSPRRRIRRRGVIAESFVVFDRSNECPPADPHASGGAPSADSVDTPAAEDVTAETASGVARTADAADGSGESDTPEPWGVGAPTSVTIDRGSVFMCEDFLRVCCELGIGILLCRPYTPTDKPHIERFFATLRLQLLEKLPGYKGHSVGTRGAKSEVEDKAVSFVYEVQELIDDYLDEVYMNSHHAGLGTVADPGNALTPNEMLDLGIATSGFLTVPADRSVAINLLAADARKITDQGIEVGYLRYNSIDLAPYRDRKSPFPNLDGKYPIRIDRRDVSGIWVYLADESDPRDGSWTWVPCTVRHGQRPFSDLEVQYIKSLSDDEDRPTTRYRQKQANTDLFEAYLVRVDNGIEATVRERRVAALGRAQTQVAARDYLGEAVAAARQVAAVDASGDAGNVVLGHFPPADAAPGMLPPGPDGSPDWGALAASLPVYDIGTYRGGDVDDLTAEEAAAEGDWA